MRVAAGDLSADAVAVVVQLHDTFTYFGRLPLRLGPGDGPKAMVATTLGALRTVRMVRMVLRAATGRDPAAIRGIEIWRGFDELTIEADPVTLLEADGELLGMASSLTVTPDATRLLVVG